MALALKKAQCNPERSLVSAVRHYALFMLNPEGVIVSWNPGLGTVHGYEASEIIGKHFSIFYTEDDRANNVPENELRMAAKEGHADDTRWLLRSNGEQFWAEGMTTAIKDRSGEVLGYAKVTRDATERRKLEGQLERSNDELQRFAYTVSHDLQEPLRTVRSYAELLTRRYSGKLDSDADEFIHFMMDAAGRMTQLLKDLLAYSQAGRSDRTVPEPTSSANILQWAIMNVDRLVKDNGGAITYDPLPMVEADQTQLSQVFQNLLINAIKYRSADPPAVHISSVRRDECTSFPSSTTGLVSMLNTTSGFLASSNGFMEKKYREPASVLRFAGRLSKATADVFGWTRKPAAARLSDSRCPLTTERNREVERGPLADVRFNADVSPVYLDDFLAYCQADTCSRIHAARMKALKDIEDLLGELFGNSDAVVLHCDFPGIHFQDPFG